MAEEEAKKKKKGKKTHFNFDAAFAGGATGSEPAEVESGKENENPEEEEVKDINDLDLDSFCKKKKKSKKKVFPVYDVDTAVAGIEAPEAEVAEDQEDLDLRRFYNLSYNMCLNFRLHRQPEHVLAFLLAELGISGSVDGNNQLIINGHFQQKQMKNALRRYVKEYVTCHICRSPDTILQKDIRLFFLQCKTCGSRCSVASIKSDFQAVTGEGAALRAKTA